LWPGTGSAQEGDSRLDLFEQHLEGGDTALGEGTANLWETEDLQHRSGGLSLRAKLFIGRLQEAPALIDISMDGRGRWLDNVFVERPWRSLAYEEVFLSA
jgi:hypothetical protein